jgi:hypothetical protein
MNPIQLSALDHQNPRLNAMAQFIGDRLGGYAKEQKIDPEIIAIAISRIDFNENDGINGIFLCADEEILSYHAVSEIEDTIDIAMSVFDKVEAEGLDHDLNCSYHGCIKCFV